MGSTNLTNVIALYTASKGDNQAQAAEWATVGAKQTLPGHEALVEDFKAPSACETMVKYLMFETVRSSQSVVVAPVSIISISMSGNPPPSILRIAPVPCGD